ncbi:hypothetical protein GO986_18655 [Deinococcus sp. HMF7620]|uniref:Uncharacterized protein n=1 Tax=Deinococcus arboris TaxID=2682977 RepID=A0A7C9MB02_9DEIO|nr:hypothetical protein [Deinococcus arboris]MVN88763.1 hypothetical protein [Deinococcus arboris]
MTMTETTRNTEVSDLLGRYAKAYGVEWRDSVEENQQAVRRLTFLLPQLWSTLSSTDQHRLYQLAKETQANPLKVTWMGWRDLIKGFRYARDMWRTMKRDGMQVAQKRVADAVDLQQTLLSTIIHLHENNGSLAGSVPKYEQALYDAARKLHQDGLYYVEYSSHEGKRLSVQCFVHPDIEFEYEPTQHITLNLVQAVNDAGGYVDGIEFIPNEPESGTAYRAGQKEFGSSGQFA